MANKNSQSTGDNSTAIIATGSVQIGFTPEQVRELCHLMMTDYLAQMQQQAEVVARARVDELSSEFLTAAAERYGSELEEKLSSFADPNTQHVFRLAQIGYCRSGSQQRKPLLVELLLKKLDGASSDYEQAVDDQAILALDRLTASQISYLAFLAWSVHIRVPTKSNEAMDDFVQASIKYASEFSFSRGELLYLAAANCLSPHGGLSTYHPLDLVWSTVYPFFFTAGGDPEQFGLTSADAIPWYPSFFDSSVRVPAFGDVQSLVDALNKLGKSSALVEEACQKFKNQQLNDADRRTRLIMRYPEIQRVLDSWDESCRQYRPTPIGLAVGVAKLTIDGRLKDIPASLILHT